MSYKIFLSPSLQKNNIYATGDTNEKVQCEKIAKATETALKRCGFKVQTGKSNDTMAKRCVDSDKFRADIHMPIHTNAFNGKVTGGTRIFCLNSGGRKACQAVLDELGKISPGTADSVTYEKNLYEINVPKALTVYLECEFHDTKKGSDWIINNITEIAEAICRGMCKYFGVKYIPATSSATDKFQIYVVKITAKNGVNIRKKPGTDSQITGTIPKGGAYTIVAEKNGTGAKKWGKLKSGIGWIALDYTKKIKL